MNAKIVPFDELAEADLIVDAVYLGGAAKNAADDPLNILTRYGNMGGFRKVGRKQQTKYVVLYSSQSNQNWPDRLDPATGLFTYYGDNKTPGSGLHETRRGGNKLLARVFDQIHVRNCRRVASCGVIVRRWEGCMLRPCPMELKPVVIVWAGRSQRSLP